MRPFTYERAKSPAEAAASAAHKSGAKFIAGGTNLLDLMKLEIEAPQHLIDVNGLSLDKIEPLPDGGMRIGALVRNSDLAADKTIRRDYALLYAHWWPARPVSCATRRRPRATFCSERVALTSMIPTSPATNAGPGAGAPRLAVSTGSMP